MSQTPFPAADNAPRPSLQRGLPLPLGRPFWVFVLLALIAVMFVIEQTLPLYVKYLIPYLPPMYNGVTPDHFQGGSTNNFVLILLGANFRTLVAEGQVWRFFTSMFLHIGLQHLLFNAYALFIFGAEMERVFGRARFITIYVISGLFGSWASFTFNDALISAGASGAIFGVIGMQLTYFFKYRKILGQFGRSRLLNILIIAVINLGFGMTVAGIDNFAHMGGLISGALLAYKLVPVYKVTYSAAMTPHVVDESGFQAQIWVVMVAVAALVVGTWAVL